MLQQRAASNQNSSVCYELQVWKNSLEPLQVFDDLRIMIPLEGDTLYGTVVHATNT